MKKPIIERKKAFIGRGKTKIVRLAPGQRMPNLQTLAGAYPAEQIPNPLDALLDTGNIEQNADQEISEALALIRAEKKERRDQFRTMVDPEFWVALCFQNRAQKLEFLEKAGWAHLGTKYLDGLKVAQRLDVDIQPIPLEAKQVRQAPKMLRNEEVIGDATEL